MKTHDVRIERGNGPSEIKTVPRKTIGAVWFAYIATLAEAGPLPECMENLPAYLASHYALMRRHDPKLASLTDEEIAAIMALEDPEL